MAFQNAQTAPNHTYRALGIDPGLAATGYAVIGTLPKGGELCAWGALKTKSTQSLPERLKIIYEEINNLIETWRPTLLVIEDVYVLQKFPKAAIQLGEVKGVINLAAQYHYVEVLPMKPTEVKSGLTGNGRATKDQVNRTVSRILNVTEEIKPDHASDATALALVGLSRKGMFKW